MRRNILSIARDLSIDQYQIQSRAAHVHTPKQRKISLDGLDRY